MAVFLPPDAATAGGVPAAGHVGEDGLGHAEVALAWIAVRGEFVAVDPGEGPPAFVVVELVEEVGMEFEGLLEGIAEGGAKAFVAREAGAIGERGDGVAGVPPAGGVEEAGVVVVEGEQRRGGGVGASQGIGPGGRSGRRRLGDDARDGDDEQADGERGVMKTTGHGEAFAREMNSDLLATARPGGSYLRPRRKKKKRSRMIRKPKLPGQMNQPPREL